MTQSPSQWLVKDRNGRIQGPFSTDTIKQRIIDGVYLGQEEICSFPGTKWMPMARHKPFYDQILIAMQGEIESRGKKSTLSEETPTPESFIREEEVSASEKKQKKLEVDDDTIEIMQTPHRKKEVLDFDRVENVEKSSNQKALIFALLAIGVVILFIIFSTHNGGSTKTNHLLTVNFKQPEKNAKAADLNPILKLLHKDDIEAYRIAEEKLVGILEKNPRDLKAGQLLCFTYQNLWPYSRQDGKDQKTFSHLVEHIVKLDPIGVAGTACNLSQLIVEMRWSDVESLSKAALETHSGESVFYYFRGLSMQRRRDLESAAAYFQKAQLIDKTWLLPFYAEALARLQLKQYEVAAKILRSIIASNKQHINAIAKLGQVQMDFLGLKDEAKANLKMAVSMDEPLLPAIELETYLRLMRLLLNDGQGQEAKDLAQKIETKFKDNAEISSLITEIQSAKNSHDWDRVRSSVLADENFSRGDYFVAQAQYRALLESDPNNARLSMQLARSLWELNRPQEAIEWMKKAVKNDPQLIDAYIYLAQFYSSQFEYAEAFAVLANAKKASPKSYKIWRGMAQVELDRNNLLSAQKFAEKAMQMYDADLESLLLMAEIYRRQNKYKEAYMYASRAIELNGYHVKAQAMFSRILIGYQGVNSAVHYVSRLIAQYPQEVEYRLALADVYFDDNQFTQAISLYENLVAFADYKKAGFLGLARSYKNLRKFNDSVKYFIEAAALNPSDGKPLFELGDAYFTAGQYKLALEQFQRLAQISPKFPLANLNAAKAAIKLNQFDLALAEVAKEKTKNPSMADPYLVGGEVYLNMGKYSLCIGEYQKAISMREVSSYVYVNLAQCYRLSGNFDLAVSMLRRAAERESGNPDVYKELGLNYKMKGDVDQAVRALRQYLVLAPSAPDKAQIESMLRQMGN